MATAVDEVKDRLNIEDVIGQYVQLKRAGRNFRGLSPFSNEKTPSFFVSPEKQIWHDFSSGRGGNIFSFVMEVEGLDFKAALEMLARQAGVDLSNYQSSSNRAQTKTNERLFQALDLAAKFYQTHLTKNKLAWRYVFNTRRFNKETILNFRLGYSPSSGQALVNFLTKRGFSSAELRQAGLVFSRNRGLNDMFRGRIMIPLCDPTGRVVGFTARALAEDGGPKYINTAQTALYDKSRNIFGLHLAKEAIRSAGYAVLVEGNLDVIASHQAGVKQVVATAGTALTEYQLKGLSRLTNDLRLSFDQDAAGIKASERAIPIASKIGINLQVVTLPADQDPDDLIKQDPAAWQKAIEQPVYGIDWLMQLYQQKIDITSGPGKRQFSDQLLGVIDKLTDPVEKDHYLTKLADLISVDKLALTTKIKASGQTSSTKKVLAKSVPKQLDDLEYLKVQDHFLALTLCRAELRQFLEPITETMITKDEAKKLLEQMKTDPGFKADSKMSGELKKLENYIKILVLQYEELYSNLEELELHYEASRLQAHLIREYVKKQKQKLVANFAGADDQMTAELLEQAKSLDQLLKMSKGVLHE